jgi:membrane protease YdiL (CAAX protease family)
MSDAAGPPQLSGDSQYPETTATGPLLAAPAAPALPDDIRTSWGGMDLALFAIFSVGMLLLLTNLLAAIAVEKFGVPAERIAQFSTTDAGFIVCRQVLWFLCILIYLYVLIRRRTSVSFWRAVGWRGLHYGQVAIPFVALVLLLAGCALAIAADAASEFYTTQKQLPIEALFADRRSVLYLMAYGLLLAPLAEETLFRGFVYPVLARKFGVFAGITFTGILFGLVHAPQLWGGWGQIATLVAVGMALTAVRAGLRSVAASYLLHLGYNGFLFGGFWFATGALQHLPK